MRFLHNQGPRNPEPEVFNALGHTVAVVNVLESQLEALRDDELLTVRQHEITAA